MWPINIYEWGITPIYWVFPSSAILDTLKGDNNELKVFYSNAYFGVNLWTPDMAITGTEKCLAARQIIYVPGCINRPPFLRIASTPFNILYNSIT